MGNSKAWLTQLLQKKRLVICFDDLERSPLPVTEVLGYINQYVEHLGAKVVVLCNENELLKGEGADLYQKTKEKVIRVTREYIGDPENAINSIIDEFNSNNNFHSYLNQQRTQIVELFNKSKLKNLRILKYGLDVLESAFEGFTTQQDEYSKASLAKLPLTLLPVTFEYQSGAFKKEDVVSVLADGGQFFALLFAGKGDNKDATSVVEKFVDKYDLSMFPPDTIESPALAKLIVDGHLDRDKLKAEIDAHNVKRPEEVRAALNFSQKWYVLQDDEFSCSVSLTIKALESGMVPEWEDLIHIMRAVGDCNSNDILPVEVSTVQKAFCAGLEHLKTTGKFVKVDDYDGRHISKHPSDVAGGLADWARGQLLAVNAELAAEKQKAAVLTAFKKSGNDPEDFVALMTESRGDGFGDKPMEKFVEPAEFVSRLTTALPAVQQRFFLAVRTRYSNNNPNVKALVEDVQWLRKVRDDLKKAIESSAKKTPSMMWLSRLHTEFEKSITFLESSHVPMPEH